MLVRHTHILKSQKSLLPTSISSSLESISTQRIFKNYLSPYFQISYLYASFLIFSDSLLTTINDKDLALFHPSPPLHTLSLSHNPVYSSSEPSCPYIMGLVRPVFSITCCQALEPSYGRHCANVCLTLSVYNMILLQLSLVPMFFLPSPTNNSPLPPVISSELGGWLPVCTEWGRKPGDHLNRL